jgi:hypothetical protein
MVTADLCGQKLNSLASCDCKFQIPVETFNEMNSVLNFLDEFVDVHSLE